MTGKFEVGDIVQRTEAYMSIPKGATGRVILPDAGAGHVGITVEFEGAESFGFYNPKHAQNMHPDYFKLVYRAEPEPLIERLADVANGIEAHMHSQDLLVGVLRARVKEAIRILDEYSDGPGGQYQAIIGEVFAALRPGRMDLKDTVLEN